MESNPFIFVVSLNSFLKETPSPLYCYPKARYLLHLPPGVTIFHSHKGGEHSVEPVTGLWGLPVVGDNQAWWQLTRPDSTAGRSNNIIGCWSVCIGAPLNRVLTRDLLYGSSLTTSVVVRGVVKETNFSSRQCYHSGSRNVIVLRLTLYARRVSWSSILWA